GAGTGPTDGSARRQVSAGDARELVRPVVVRRLQLVPVVHAVIALELRVVRYGVRRRATVVVHVQPHRLVEQREEEQVTGGTRGRLSQLARAVHIGLL